MIVSQHMARYRSIRRELHWANDSSFCGLSAFMLVTGMRDHERANAMLGRRRNRGISGNALLSAINKVGYKCQMVKQPMNGYVRNIVKNAAKKGVDLSTGTHLVFSTRHVSCLKDGELLDWTGEEDTVNVRVWAVYTIEKEAA